jgi:hypothetical protein
MPDDVLAVERWDEVVVDDSSFRIIHGVVIDRAPSPASPTLDCAWMASEEGISRLEISSDGTSTTATLGAGELDQQPQTGFKGSGNLAIGTVGGRPLRLYRRRRALSR